MKRKFILAAACAFLFSVLYGCDKLPWAAPKKEAMKEEKTEAAPVPQGPIVAKVNNMVITLDDFNQEVDAINAFAKDQNKPEAQITTRDKKLDYLKNEMIRRLLFYQAALDKGLDRKDEVQKALQKYRETLLVGALANEETKKIDVSSAEIEDYYNKYKEQLKEPEERQIREIVVSTEAEAKDILIELLKGGDFADLAKQRSKSASASNGGDLGFLPKGKKFPAFDDVAFSDTLESGQYSQIFKGPDGYYIVKLEAKKGGKQKSLSEMWEDIKRGLQFVKQQQHLEELIGKLSQEAKIEVHEGEIK